MLAVVNDAIQAIQNDHDYPNTVTRAAVGCAIHNVIYTANKRLLLCKAQLASDCLIMDKPAKLSELQRRAWTIRRYSFTDEL